MSRQARNQVILLSALGLMAMFNLTLVSAGLEDFIEAKLEFSETDISIGVFMSAEMFAYIIFAPIWGHLSDKHGKRAHYVVMGLGISSLLFVLMSASIAPCIAGMPDRNGIDRTSAWPSPVDSRDRKIRWPFVNSRISARAAP